MPTKKKPILDPEVADVSRKGDTVTMPVATFDALIARIVQAEVEQQTRTQRSWWKP